MAFLDILPFVEGHTQVITKKHYRWVWEIPQPGEFFKVAAKIARHFQKVTGDEFVTGIVWGMMVPHAHIQLLPCPRKIDLTWARNELTKKKGQELAQKLALR